MTLASSLETKLAQDFEAFMDSKSGVVSKAHESIFKTVSTQIKPNLDSISDHYLICHAFSCWQNLPSSSDGGQLQSLDKIKLFLSHPAVDAADTTASFLAPLLRI